MYPGFPPQQFMTPFSNPDSTQKEKSDEGNKHSENDSSHHPMPKNSQTNTSK